MWVRMYAEKLLDLQKCFIDLTNTLLSAWYSNVVYIVLSIWHYLALVYITKINLPNPVLFSTDSLKLDWIPSKIKWKIRISNFKDADIKRYNMQLSVLLFLNVLHKQISFLKLFRTSFNTIWRKIFITNFSFLTDSPKSPHPLNGQNLLNMVNVFVEAPLYYNDVDTSSSVRRRNLATTIHKIFETNSSFHVK